MNLKQKGLSKYDTNPKAIKVDYFNYLSQKLSA
jgi:hypothetical protein